jgi:hypothetical protein
MMETPPLFVSLITRNTVITRIQQIAAANFKFSAYAEQAGSHSVSVTDNLVKTATGWQWQVEFSSGNTPTGPELLMEIESTVNADTRLWLPWADPRPGHEVRPDESVRMADGVVRGNIIGWSDPLEPQPWRGDKFSYGATPYEYEKPNLFFCPFLGSIICLPMVTRIDGDRALTFALRPQDARIDLVIETTKNGNIRFRHKHYRVGGGVYPSFTIEVFEHAADVRAALGAVVAKWPEYFDPCVPLADEVAGTGAYSTHMGDMDPEKMRSMAFGVNWKASFDFPFMGLFLPPVSDIDEEWTSFGGRPMSIRKMRDYATEIRRHGFHVLSYLNLNEFGAKVQVPPPCLPDTSSWKDQYSFLFARFPHAVLHPPAAEKPDVPDLRVLPPDGSEPPVYWSWEGCVAMDPGDPAFAEFLVEQAARHLREIPDASGISIDRIDWVRLFNHEADDGVAWLGDRPVRSLHTSHQQIMERLGALIHGAGKVIFMNNHVKRLEQMRHIDGIFDEFSYGGCSLNSSALLCLRKPALGWTASEDQIRSAGPDHYYQRHLYMGMYPMAPFPGNDHSLCPSEFADCIATDYGSLFNLLRGKKWVLLPGLVSLEDPAAKWNCFETCQGLVFVVAFAGNNPITMRIHDAGRLSLGAKPDGVVYTPGCGSSPKPALVKQAGKDLEISITPNRGCAVLLFPGAPATQKVRMGES